MELWRENTSAWTVEEYLRRLQVRLNVHARINDDLSPEQRALLKEEAERLVPPIVELRRSARALEDFEDQEILERRETVVVHDDLVDGAQDEAWKVVGLRGNVLAGVGQTREKVFATPRITEIKEASREVTVDRAARVATNLRGLPAFDERDRLVARLEQRGANMAEGVKALQQSEARGAALLRELHRTMDAHRVAVVAAYGRLLARCNKRFVESLFRRAHNGHTRRPAPAPAPTPNPA